MNWSCQRVVRLSSVFCLVACSAMAPSPAVAQDQSLARRNVWALLVGIERYEQDADFPRCRGAARDAVDLARWFIEEADWSPDHVLLLTDMKPEEWHFRDPARQPAHRMPSRKALDDGIAWLTRTARKGDVVLVFFAGQALSLPGTHENERPDRPPRPRDYLVPWDARSSDLERETGWRLGEAIEPLATRGEFSIVCLLDTSPTGRIRALGCCRNKKASHPSGGSECSRESLAGLV